MTHPFPKSLRVIGLSLLLSLSLGSCTRPADLCAPVDDRIGFFSQGDCVFTRAPFFRGHEWLSFFGNEQLRPSTKFNQSQTQRMAMGNRRVDYPKQLLAHMDNGVLAYISALKTYTGRPEVQAHHFLLSARNTEIEAAHAAQSHIQELTRRGLQLWTTNPVRALTLFGQAQHTLQDSFSPAHTIRRTESPLYGLTSTEAAALPTPAATDMADSGLEAGVSASPTPTLEANVVPCTGQCSCIKRVKAYLKRAPGYNAGVLFHGGNDDDDDDDDDGSENIGHLTSQDSIYRKGRNCHRPETRGQVWACLDRHARQGAQGTAAYLRLLKRMINERNIGEDFRESVLAAPLAEFTTAHLSLCSEL